MIGGFLSKRKIEQFIDQMSNTHGIFGILAISIALLGSIVFILYLSSIITQWAWNNSMPFISNGVLPAITLKHAFALMILISTLFSTSIVSE